MSSRDSLQKSPHQTFQDRVDAALLQRLEVALGGVGDGRDGATRVVQRVARQGLEVKEADDGFLGPEQLGLKRHFHSNRLIKMKCPMPK